MVFLSRRGSAQPFVSKYQEDMGVSTLTDFFEVRERGGLCVLPERVAGLTRAVQRAYEAMDGGTYLHLPFTTLFEYLKVGGGGGQGAGGWRGDGRRGGGRRGGGMPCIPAIIE